MTHHHRILLVSVFAGLLTTGGPLRAQDDQPAAAAPAAPAKAPPEKKAGDKKAADAAPAETEPYHPPDPAVDTIEASDPKTLRALMQAIISLRDLDRTDLALKHLKQLLAAKPDAATLADLARTYGSAAFIQLAGDKSFAPQGRQLSDMVLTAAQAQAHDSAQLTAQAKQLADPSPDKQREALVALHDGGALAVGPLLAVLVEPKQTIAVQTLAHQALVDLGDDAVPPLVAALAAPDASVQITALEALAEIRPRTGATDFLLAPYLSASRSPEVRHAAEQALLQIVGSTPTKADALYLLDREARAYLEHQKVLQSDAGDLVTVWQWDPATHGLARATFLPERAAAFIAARLAGDLVELDPNSTARRQLNLVSLLESATYRAGLDNPLPSGLGTENERAAKFGVKPISDALATAIAGGHTAAATAAARILGDIADAKLLTADGAKLCPLVAALRSHDRRLRWAAAEAVMKLKPSAPFSGSSYLTEVLADAAASAGRRRAVIGFPTVSIATQLAGLTNALGYESETASNGRQLFEMAAESPDTELVFVSGRINNPPVEDVLQQLRRDPRTADLPICVMAELDEADYLKPLVESVPRAFLVLRPEKLDEMKQAVARAMELTGDRLVPARLRQQQAIQALDGLAILAAGPPQTFDVRLYEPIVERALYSPRLSPHAAAVLTKLGTRSSQLSLVELASNGTQSLANRQAAAAQFSASVRQYGLRLAPSEVARQYDRYNQSAVQDKETQKLLGFVLDAIELPTKKPARPAKE